MAKKILITGGSGMIGRLLTSELLKKDYSVNHLSRKPGNIPSVKTYIWNVDKEQIDAECIDGVDTIIHLAGAGIMDKPWTKKRKQELISSRTKSIELIYQLLKNKPHQVKSVISASATGYYGNQGDKLLTVNDPPSHDFLGRCCMEWEQSVSIGEQLGLRVLKLRTGVVLSKDGGALPRLSKSIKYGYGSPLGTGKQWVPWIHWRDVVCMYIYGIEHEISGVYNLVAPVPVTNEQLTQAIAKQLNKPLWLPHVPAFILRLILGKRSQLVLDSTKVSAEEIIKDGYHFKYPDIASALKRWHLTNSFALEATT